MPKSLLMDGDARGNDKDITGSPLHEEKLCSQPNCVHSALRARTWAGVRGTGMCVCRVVFNCRGGRFQVRFPPIMPFGGAAYHTLVRLILQGTT